MALRRGLRRGMERSALEGLQVPGDTTPPGFAGSLPATMGALSGWTGTAMWDVAWNFGDCTAGSCASLTGSTSSVTLSDLSADPTELSGPQAGWADQGGIRVTTATQLLFSGNAALTVSTTIPSAYMLVFSCAAGPSGVQAVMSGYTGFGNEGWGIEALGASGLRVRAMGSASGYVAGSTAAFDGLPHAIMVVVDDAAGKVKLFTEWGTAELTGLTYSQTGANLLTIGPESTGASWYEPVDYYQAAHGKHPLAYANAATALSTYHTALTTGVAPAAITSLPLSLADLNSAAGFAFTEGWNLSTAAPVSMGTKPDLQVFTGTFIGGGGTGTTPTITAAPQLRNSFTAQPVATFDSNGDNFWAAGAIPDVAHTGMLLVKSPNGTHPGANRTIIGKDSTTAANTAWKIRSASATWYQLEVYDVYPGTARSATVISGSIANDGLWHLLVWRRDNSGGTNRLKVDAIAAAASASVTVSPAAVSAEGGFGRLYQSPQSTVALQPISMALFAWSTGLATDGQIDSIAAAFRWRYGL